MKFGYTILYVDDVRRTLDFYVAAFGLSVRFLHESGDFGEREVFRAELCTPVGG